eukprot:CAMPEP_0174835272 /NCGR_PEP_ID=MMETSP1114-20130205/5322_1 /TAXON_ID=312471 /ORGANISM="Neobodo designis, Strain CCAP 1951/1" /LENGTH=224 /DNA_ID=CAMNT_0016069217 /DNA_START=145 /DNA_END=820 /DNA_ORIENTATION=+
MFFSTGGFTVKPPRVNLETPRTASLAESGSRLRPSVFERRRRRRDSVASADRHARGQPHRGARRRREVLARDRDEVGAAVRVRRGGRRDGVLGVVDVLNGRHVARVVVAAHVDDPHVDSVPRIRVQQLVGRRRPHGRRRCARLAARRGVAVEQALVLGPPRARFGAVPQAHADDGEKHEDAAPRDAGVDVPLGVVGIASAGATVRMYVGEGNEPPKDLGVAVEW